MRCCNSGMPACRDDQYHFRTSHFKIPPTTTCTHSSPTNTEHKSGLHLTITLVFALKQSNPNNEVCENSASPLGETERSRKRSASTGHSAATRWTSQPSRCTGTRSTTTLAWATVWQCMHFHASTQVWCSWADVRTCRLFDLLGE